MPIAIDCRYRPGGAEDRLAIRDIHLEYMIANKPWVIAGGAAMQGPQVVGMYLLLATGEMAEAEAFLDQEPYTRAGLFAEVRKTFFEGYIPEPHEGFLAGLLEAARASIGR